MDIMMPDVHNHNNNGTSSSPSSDEEYHNHNCEYHNHDSEYHHCDCNIFMNREMSNPSRSLPKTGRKGDPRMHRAVAARLADPSLSLFDALKIGGFDYPADDDSSVIDSERVKLGQRKNQLSRRVRLAKKQNKNSQHFAMEGGDPIHHNNATSSSSAAATHPHHNPPHQQHQQQQLAGTKHSLLDEEESLSRSEPTTNGEEDSRHDSELRMAKFHPQYHPILVQPKRHAAATSLGALSHVAAKDCIVVPQAAAPQQPTTAPSPHFYSPALPSPTPVSAIANAAISHHTSSGSSNHHHSNPVSATQPLPLGAAPLASGVAVASLNQTAAKAGITLEQLALVLQSHTTLAQVISSASEKPPAHFFKTAKELAMTFYKNECRVLYEKVMLQAGFPPEEAREGSKPYMEFAWEAWQDEGQRLQQQILENAVTTNVLDPPLQPKAATDVEPSAAATATAPAQQQEQHPPTAAAAASTYEQQQQQQQDAAGMPPPSGETGRAPSVASTHDHSHVSVDDDDEENGSAAHTTKNNNSCGNEGRHLHRLEGKCGHRAILHQPPDGSAHIDFVVGDEVECYHGVKPVATSKDDIGHWLSKYKCQDLSCTDEVCQSRRRLASSAKGADPKILHLSDINLDGKEWNADFGNDETLMGLFKLGSGGGATTASNSDAGTT